MFQKRFKEIMEMTEQEVYIRRILIEKLEEMAKIKPDDFINYPKICSIMNEIAKTLLNE